MITYGVDGRPKRIKQKDVASGSDTTIYTVTSDVDAFLDRLHVCNKTVGAVTFDCWIVDTYLYKGMSVAANNVVVDKDMGFRLLGGETLKIRASAATSLDITAVIIEISKNTPRK